MKPEPIQPTGAVLVVRVCSNQSGILEERQRTSAERQKISGQRRRRMIPHTVCVSLSLAVFPLDEEKNILLQAKQPFYRGDLGVCCCQCNAISILVTKFTDRTHFMASAAERAAGRDRIFDVSRSCVCAQNMIFWSCKQKKKKQVATTATSSQNPGRIYTTHTRSRTQRQAM